MDGLDALRGVRGLHVRREAEVFAHDHAHAVHLHQLLVLLIDVLPAISGTDMHIYTYM